MLTRWCPDVPPPGEHPRLDRVASSRRTYRLAPCILRYHLLLYVTVAVVGPAQLYRSRDVAAKVLAGQRGPDDKHVHRRAGAGGLVAHRGRAGPLGARYPGGHLRGAVEPQLDLDSQFAGDGYRLDRPGCGGRYGALGPGGDGLAGGYRGVSARGRASQRGLHRDGDHAGKCLHVIGAGIELLAEQVVHWPVAVVDHHGGGAAVEGTRHRGVRLRRHQRPRDRIIASPWVRLLPGRDACDTFHVHRYQHVHQGTPLSRRRGLIHPALPLSTTAVIRSGEAGSRRSTPRQMPPPRPDQCAPRPATQPRRHPRSSAASAPQAPLRTAAPRPPTRPPRPPPPPPRPPPLPPPSGPPRGRGETSPPAPAVPGPPQAPRPAA